MQVMILFTVLLFDSCALAADPQPAPTEKQEPLVFGYWIAPHSNIGTGTLGPYAEMSLKELQRRFFHPKGYKDKFARANALSAMLERKYVHRGMTKAEVRAVLGSPAFTYEAPNEPYRWGYDDVVGDFYMFFNPHGRVSSIVWGFEYEPGGSVPNYSHEY